MSRKQPRWQCTIRALMILTSAAALGLVVLRAFLVHGGKVLAGVVILAIPVLMLTIVMHVTMLGLSQAATMLSSIRQKTRSRADTVQH